MESKSSACVVGDESDERRVSTGPGEANLGHGVSVASHLWSPLSRIRAGRLRLYVMLDDGLASGPPLDLFAGCICLQINDNVSSSKTFINVNVPC